MKQKNIVFIVGLITIIIIIVTLNMINKNNKQYNFLSYEVQRGDTTWAIASENMPAGMDIREYIYLIEKDNSIKAGNIYPKMVLILRRYKE